MRAYSRRNSTASRRARLPGLGDQTAPEVDDFARLARDSAVLAVEAEALLEGQRPRDHEAIAVLLRERDRVAAGSGPDEVACGSVGWR